MSVKSVKLFLTNNFFYKGDVIKEDDDFLTIKDYVGNTVTINKKNIIVREVWIKGEDDGAS